MLSPTQNTIYFIIAFLILLFSVAVIIAGIIVVHDLPYKIAEKKNHPQKDAIRCMSIMGLIMFPLWLLAMIWAYIRHTSSLAICTDPQSPSPKKKTISKKRAYIKQPEHTPPETSHKTEKNPDNIKKA